MKTKIATKKILLLSIILAIGTCAIIYASPDINNKHNNNTIVNNSNLNTADLKKIKQDYDSVSNQAKELKSNMDIQHNKDNKLIVNENNITTIMVTHNLNYAINLGNRLIMMHRGNVTFDFNGDEKKKLTVEKLLDHFGDLKIKEELSDRVIFS